MRVVRNPWGLTPAQAAAMDALCLHGRNDATARALGISARTLEMHLLHAREAMGEPERLLAAIKWDRWRQATEDGHA